jgi:hypothetical protein
MWGGAAFPALGRSRERVAPAQQRRRDRDAVARRPHHPGHVPRARGPANLSRGLRHYFVVHTYRRLDRDGVFHTQWSGDGAEIAS